MEDKLNVESKRVAYEKITESDARNLMLQKVQEPGSPMKKSRLSFIKVDADKQTSRFIWYPYPKRRKMSPQEREGFGVRFVGSYKYFGN